MKKSELRTMIRKLVREEVAFAIKEVITELKQPSLSSEPTKPVKKKSFTKNSVLNDVLNETAQGGDWKTLGGKEFTTDRMNELVGGQYADIMNNTQPTQNMAASMGVNPNDPAMSFLNKDYREVLKKAEEKSKQKHGR